MTRRLILATLVLWCIHRTTLGGMGQNVGHEELIATFSTLWLVVWPLGALRHGPAWRVTAYLTAPACYAVTAFLLVHTVRLPEPLHAAFFNHYGETLIFTELFRGVLLTALTALTLEGLRWGARKAEVGVA